MPWGLFVPGQVPKAYLVKRSAECMKGMAYFRSQLRELDVAEADLV
ncbi:MAG: hypothetical protein ACP5T5_04775 [Thermoprotei archaeon]